MHVLKNGHPAHVFTEDDRRKAASVTNEIRREKRALAEQLWLNEEMRRMLALKDARRRRKREKERARRARLREEQNVEVEPEPPIEPQALELTRPVDSGRPGARPFDSGRYEY